MKLKSLLFMVTLLLTCLGVRADEKVVFEQHFDSEQTADPSAVGFYEYINSQEGDERSVSDGALVFSNTDAFLCNTERWQRAVKFRNLPLEEGKIYRLSFWLKGSKTYNDGTNDVNCKLSTLLLQGEDNADISLLDYNGAEQRLEAENFNSDAFVNYSKKFVFASEQQQKDVYNKGELADKFFLSLSVYNPGLFFIKDVVLTETNAIASAEFGMYAIKINFGNNTNIADLANASEKGRLCFDDLSFASVKVDGVDATVEAIEYHSDGCLYIFVDAEQYELTDENEVSVSFTNPTDEKQIKFKGSIESPASLFNFENVEVTNNTALDEIMSDLWQPAELISSNPKKNAFSIDKNLNEFTFVFDKKVGTSDIKAVLLNGNTEEELVLKEGQEELSDTVVLVRVKDTELSKTNEVRIDASTVVTDKGQNFSEDYTGYNVKFEAGKPKVAEEIITPVQTILFDNDAANTIPTGWTAVIDKDDKGEGEVRASGTSQGSGPRIFGYGSGDYQKVLYMRATKGAETHCYSTATYGNIEGYAATLPVGLLHIDFLASGYKGAGQSVKFEILDAKGENVLASLEKTTSEVTPDGGPASMEKFTIEYDNKTEQNVILRYTVLSTGYSETMFAGVVINTYEKTEGDVPDDKNILVDPSFGGAGNNRSPKAESGWELWQAGEMRAFDTDFNYNGTRIFNDLGLKGLKIGYYCNGQWPNGFIQYGAAAGEGAPKLALAQATHEFTLYAANWKENISREIHLQVLDETGTEVYVDKVFNTSPVNMEGSRGASYEADKFTFAWDCPAEGNYIVRFGSPAGETLIGNLSIIQPGSRAVKFYALLATAVKAAKATLAKVADPMYNGATKTALEEVIAKYEDQEKIDMTTEEEFKDAIAEVEGLTKSMETRFEYIPRFKTAYAAAVEQFTGAIGTKYEQLESYKKLEEGVATYEGVDPSDLEDEELVSATTNLENNSALFNNMKNTCVGLLTKQIAGLAAQLVSLDETKVDDEYVLAAGNVVSDDQEIASQLKLRITKAIYDQCAAGDPFNKPLLDPETNEDTGITEAVTIDATNFIQNFGFYCTEGWPGTVNGFPGWTIEKIQGNVGPSYGISSWGGERATALKPVIEASIRTDWGTHEYDASQYIMLPMAKATVSIIVGEDGGNPHEAYAYVGEGDAQVKKYYDGQNPGAEDNSFSRDTNIPREFADVTPEANDDATLGSILLGAHARVNGGFARVDDAKLVLTGKLEGFDYAAAAAKLADQITAIEKVQQSNEPAEAPVKVVYYDLNGVATSTPQGIAIKVATYANGYVKVTKVTVK